LIPIRPRTLNKRLGDHATFHSILPPTEWKTAWHVQKEWRTKARAHVSLISLPPQQNSGLCHLPNIIYIWGHPKDTTCAASEVTNEWTMQKVGTGLAHKLKSSMWPPLVSSIKEGKFLRWKRHRSVKTIIFSTHLWHQLTGTTGD
jgi:hypothetical protein